MPFIGATSGPASTHLTRGAKNWGSGVTYASGMALRGALTGGVSTAPLVVNKPTGTAVGDIIVVFATSSGATMSLSGFTSKTSAQINFEAFFWRVADGTEGSTFTITSSGTVAGVCAAFSGGIGGATVFDPSTPAGCIVTTGNQGTGPTILGLENSASKATTKNGDILLYLIDAHATSGTFVNTFPTGFVGATQNSGTNVFTGLGWMKQTAAGTTGTVTGNLSGGVGTPTWGLQLVALQSA